jgi:carbamoyltransferase
MNHSIQKVSPRGSRPHPAIHTGRPSQNRPLNIIGISAGYHDSACCLMQDGALVAAAQEERFSRLKHDKSFPRRAFRYCLEQAGITIADIDCLAYYEDPCQKLGRQIWMGLGPSPSAARREAILDRLARLKPQQAIRQLLGYEGPVEIFDHHLSHAASSFYFSGFEEAAIMTVDGVGDWPTTTYGFGKGSRIERFEQVDFPDSLGFFYSAITSYLGFEVNDGEYKVMGLAPYGKPIYADQIRELVELQPTGQYRLNMKYFAFLNEDMMYSEPLSALLGQPPRQPESEIRQFHQDVARSAQFILEEILLEKARYLYRQAPSENLCMAGGVALNCVANRRILKDGPFKRLFVQPAAGDAGGSLGAAALAHARLTGETPARKRLEHVYLGPSFSGSEVQEFLQSTSAPYEDYRGREKELIRVTAEHLAKGKVIGWFQGRMEFGPRALGSRSILADPRRPEMRDRINALVKMREAFRPFAPAVLESRTTEHFELDHPSPFMLETCQVKSAIELPAVEHVDGSARVQTVAADTNRRFAALLEEFHRRTGCPILLNTSFNMRGEPIVCNPVDAIMCFVRSKIDVLVIEDFILERASIPPLWKLQAQGGMAKKGNPDEAISHLVYTLL